MRTRDAAMGMVFCLAVSLAGAADYFVAGEDPRASDENPGTKELPWKTLVHAGATAQAGDHVYIRGGVYRETLTVENAGTIRPDSPPVGGFRAPSFIVFEAYGDEAVVIDGSNIVPAGQWQPVEDAPGVYGADLSRLPADWDRGPVPRGLLEGPEGFVFFNDSLLGKHRVRDLETGAWAGAVPGPEDAMTRFFDGAAGRLYVNLGGADPRQPDNRVEVTVRRSGIWARGREYVTFRKLTLRRFNSSAIEANRTQGMMVEDCLIHHVGTGFRVGGISNIIRRNRVHHTINRGTDYGGSFGSLVQENIVTDFGLARRGYQTFAFTIFRGRHVQFLHNIAYQSPSIGHGGGFWPDVPNISHVWRGNAGVHAGYYIESPIIGNLLQWNTALYTDMHLRDNRGSTATENLVAWSPRSGLISGGLNRRTTFSGNWLKGNRVGISAGAEIGRPGVQRLNSAQGNIYEVPADGYAANWAGRPYRTLEEFRAVTGQETLGEQVDEIDLAELPLVWVRLAGMEDGHKPFPLFGNPGLTDHLFCTITRGADAGFFWARGDSEWDGKVDRPEISPSQRMRPRSGSEFPGTRLKGGSPWSTVPAAEQTGLEGFRNMAPVDGTPVGSRVYVVSSYTGSVLCDKGFGIWSPSLPTVPGATIDLEIWMTLIDVVPSGDNGGAVVFVEWSNWTGQNRRRSYLVGGDGGAVANPEFNRGSRDWSKVAGSLTAPEGAKRFALFLGFRAAAGQVMYGSVERMNTRPGVAPAAPADPREDETMQPLIDPADLEFSIVDLSAFVNRALEDEEADDGQGGWTDQGPGYDMTGLQTGWIEHQGVPYMILEPQSCVVLDSRRRPQSDLPRQVDLPVDEKADVLYFLHSGAWIGRGIAWRYELHYADGEVVEIPVVGDVHIRDWSHAGLPYDFINTDQRRAFAWPETAGNALSPDCGLYVLEHLNPRPEIPIRAIRFAQAENRVSVPILLNITLGRIQP